MKLYVYNHCPYCVRVLFVLGLKKINCNVEYFLNDDVDGPVNLVGSKQVPILEKDDGEAMPESLDIIKYLDSLNADQIIAPASNRQDLAQWISETQMIIRQLMMPRWVRFKEPEFSTKAARDYFTFNKEKMIGSFSQNLAKSSQLIAFMTEKLEELVNLFKGDVSLNEKLSLDDINLWSRLCGLTGVKGLKFPKKIRHYLDYYAEKTGIKLYDDKQI